MQCFHVGMILYSKLHQRINVRIHGALAKYASARIRQNHFTAARKERTKEQNRSAEFLHEIVRNFFAFQMVGFDPERVVLERMFHAEECENLEERKDIRDLRNVMKSDFLPCKQRSTHTGKRRIFGTSYGHLAPKRRDTFDAVPDVLGHSSKYSRSITPTVMQLSATLKSGHHPICMKSVTWPSSKRSTI